MANDFNANSLTQIFKEKVLELQEEPEFQRSTEKTKFATDKNSSPTVKLAVGNVPLDYDLWEGLRNPAVVGMYPAGLREIWEFYANRRRGQVDETGRQTIFQVPRSFEFALNNYQRAVIISVMLPFSKTIVRDYVDQVIKEKKTSSYRFTSMYEDINRMADKALTRTAIELVTKDSDRIVVAFNNDTVKAISTEAIPQTRQGGSHGPSKGGNYPQKSIAALVGLGLTSVIIFIGFQHTEEVFSFSTFCSFIVLPRLKNRMKGPALKGLISSYGRISVKIVPGALVIGNSWLSE